VGTDMPGTGLPWVEAIAASFPPYSFTEFHTSELPELNARTKELVVADLAGAPPIGFRIPDGRAYTWLSTPNGINAVEGDAEAEILVEIDEVTFSQYLHELLTASGSVRTGRATLARGSLTGWKRWEPATRTLISGRPIYTESVWDTLVDRNDKPLNLFQVFPADGDSDEMRHFLNTAGYLHIKGVYTPEEVAALGAEVEVVRSKASPGDPFSWWSLNAAGDEVVTRINYLGRYSDMLQQFSFDPRMTGYAILGNPELRVCDDRLDGPMVFIKNPAVVKGDGDLGWHVDDGIGGHPVMCPLIQVGIQLDHANAANGQLMVLAGSHRYTKHWLNWGEEGKLPLVALETEPGDITLHFGDIMHSTPPPTASDAGRRVLYYKFAEEKTFEWVPSGCHYNDALFHADATGKVSTRATTY
jgi:hypothetical protein